MINSKEIENVLKCSKEKQYEYFIKKVVDNEELWLLRDEEGWASLGDDSNEYLPLWPKKEFAEICISEEWNGYYAEAVDLEEFIDEWIDDLMRDNVRLTLMWYCGSGIEIPLTSFKEDLEYEMENY